jgi:formylglycine-generating enzyme required for sulfatase activity
VDQTFTFGPKLTALTNPSADAGNANGSTFDLEVRSFMGPFPVGMPGTPEDIIKLELADNGTTASWQASFKDNSQEDETEKILKGHDEASKLTVKIWVKPRSVGIPYNGSETLTIRANSSVFPGLRHEIKVPIGEFSLIPAGNFQMGDTFAELATNERPVHTVNVSDFYMAKHETTKALWDEVRAWGSTRGYTDLPSGGGKGALHPVHSVSWFDIVKWCNARSERNGLVPVYTNGANVMRSGTTAPTANWSANGYRLPTEAEWEKAARGGLSGSRFPWGNTISHSQANYYAVGTDYGNQSGDAGNHPTYNDGVFPYSSPVGSFAPNGYGLYDMAGNMWEWCWDWYGSSYYGSSPASDPRGPGTGSFRVLRGGSWVYPADYCRAAVRAYSDPTGSSSNVGFRAARSSVP